MFLFLSFKLSHEVQLFSHVVYLNSYLTDPIVNYRDFIAVLHLAHRADVNVRVAICQKVGFLQGRWFARLGNNEEQSWVSWYSDSGH